MHFGFGVKSEHKNDVALFGKVPGFLIKRLSFLILKIKGNAFIANSLIVKCDIHTAGKSTKTFKNLHKGPRTNVP